jgi:hypothetical protein
MMNCPVSTDFLRHFEMRRARRVRVALMLSLRVCEKWSRLRHLQKRLEFPGWVERPNKACSGRRGFFAIYRHFSGFEFILIPSFDLHSPPVRR